jgi:hypothetical protein
MTSTLRVTTIQNTNTSNIITQTNATTLTIGASGQTINVPSVASFASTIGVGGATPAASGAGITFPATASDSTDGNTLDDYEEGTWTPTLTKVTVGNGVFSAREYIKIGKQVFVIFNFTFGSTTTVASGDILISNLPFANGGSGTGSAWLFNSGTGAYNMNAVLPSSTSNDFRIASGVTNGTDSITNSSPFTWAVNDRINFAGVYRST